MRLRQAKKVLQYWPLSRISTRQKAYRVAYTNSFESKQRLASASVSEPNLEESNMDSFGQLLEGLLKGAASVVMVLIIAVIAATVLGVLIGIYWR